MDLVDYNYEYNFLIVSVFSHSWPMADITDSPMAVKVEEHSQCVILTYFQGDINSMVDAHFSRALSKVCKAKAPAVKTKRIRKTIKLGKHTNSTVYLTTNRKINPIHPHYMTSFFVPRRGNQPLSGECCWLLLTGPSCGRTSPVLQPCRRRSWLLALVHCQGRRGLGVAVPCILPVPRRIESYWAAIRHIPAQPTA